MSASAVDDLLTDPDLIAALRHLGRRERSRPQPVCPRCGQRPQSTPDGWCADCAHQAHEAAKASKRRWWSEHGREWRAARNAAARAGQLGTAQLTPAQDPARAGRAQRARQAQSARAQAQSVRLEEQL